MLIDHHDPASVEPHQKQRVSLCESIPHNRNSAVSALEFAPLNQMDLRVGILKTAAYLLRELSSDEFCSIELCHDDPSGIRLRKLALDIADALETIHPS